MASRAIGTLRKVFRIDCEFTISRGPSYFSPSSLNLALNRALMRRDDSRMGQLNSSHTPHSLHMDTCSAFGRVHPDAEGLHDAVGLKSLADEVPRAQVRAEPALDAGCGRAAAHGLGGEGRGLMQVVPPRQDDEPARGLGDHGLVQGLPAFDEETPSWDRP